MTVAEQAAYAANLQTQWEDALTGLLDTYTHRFLTGVLADATNALGTPALLAAGRRPDPFAFTNVMARWTTTVNLLMGTPRSQLAHPALLDDIVERVLRESDIPHTAAAKVVEVLTIGQREQWTKARIKRELRANIIPTRPPDVDKQSVEWSWYKARVRRVARTASTRATSLRVMEDPGTHKRWTARDDARVRDSHDHADGQTVPRSHPFTVGGFPMQYPGDPAAPASETANCRCVLVMLTPNQEETSMPPELTAAANPVTRWAGPIAFEGVLTGDGRLIQPGALTWDETEPVPFRHVVEDHGSHDGAAVVGRIDSISRGSGGQIIAEGMFDTGSDAGVEAARLVGEKITTGVSVDLDEVSFEIRVRAELLNDMDEPPVEDPDAEGPAETDDEGRVTVYAQKADDEVMVITSARVRAATLADIPAFSEARIALTETSSAEREPAAVTAAAIPAPPAAWFTNPELAGPTGITVTDDGRVYGHLALWPTEHIGFTDQRVVPPHSATDYAYFHTGAITVRTATGDRELSVGRLTVDTGHAAAADPALRAMAHYDNTGAAAAYVRAGEDKHGIWVAGVVKPSATEEQIHTLKASPLSGDWRRIQGGLELVAALSVNVGGFPVPRPAGFVASGHQMSLVASGIVTAPPGGALDWSERQFVQGLMAERARAEKARGLSSRVAGIRSQRRVAAMAARLRQNGGR